MTAENVLLVEGESDKRTLPELLEGAGLPWGSRAAPIVRIHTLGGIRKLDREEVVAQLKRAGLRRLGLIVDADEDPQARWASIRGSFADHFTLPEAPASQGTILPAGPHLPQLGIWMMPDNGRQGMLETFLLALRSGSNSALLEHAETSCAGARVHGAPYAEAQRDKALTHTWLAWQDPPGRQLHEAVRARVLDPRHESAADFVRWFKALYEL